MQPTTAKWFAALFGAALVYAIIRYHLVGDVSWEHFFLSPAITTLPMMPKAIRGRRWKRNQRMGYVALLFVVAHLVALGWRGWLAPSGWNGGMPPISLVALTAALIPLLVKRKQIKEKRERQQHAD